MIEVIIIAYIILWITNSYFTFVHFQKRWPSIAQENFGEDIGFSLMFNLFPPMWFLGFGFICEYLRDRKLS